VSLPALRSRGRAVGTLVALGAAALGATVPVWVRTTVSTALEPDVAVEVAGTTAAPAVSAAALVVVAAGLVLAIAGRIARWLALAVAALAGALVAASAVAVLADPVPTATAGAADAAGVTDLTSPVALTPWPWLAAAVGVLVVVAAVLAALGAPAWAATSGRHERADVAGEKPARTEPDAHDDWDALSRGTDPSADQ
jgi:uncharacterized membrane protein (TIGR02234 family)